MTKLVFHHDHQQLPLAREGLLPVQLYGLSGQRRGDVSVIGSPVIDKVRRFGVNIPSQAIDFLTIALAATAADTFVRRSDSENGWTRQFTMQIPLHDPAPWISLKADLERALHFLSGDMWEFKFMDGGKPPPSPYQQRGRLRRIQLQGIDSVCLFSGGLDSAIGAINLLEEGRAPLLVSHSYKGDKKHQDQIVQVLPGRHSHFAVNAHPRSCSGRTDITMRTRSLNFLAFAAVGACAVQAVSQNEIIDLFVPENGFISLNPPLTTRRIGTLSTRTTHPYFINSIQEIFAASGIPCRIINPYQLKTKGQMVAECRNMPLLSDIVDRTVSCSHWKRSNQQCGVCVPCIIRRAALHRGGVHDGAEYSFRAVGDVLNDMSRRDDLLALRIAIAQKEKRRIGPWIADSGPLPASAFDDFQKVFREGLDEVKAFLDYEDTL